MTDVAHSVTHLAGPNVLHTAGAGTKSPLIYKYINLSSRFFFSVAQAIKQVARQSLTESRIRAFD